MLFYDFRHLRQFIDDVSTLNFPILYRQLTSFSII
jgi:hypothetical protein